MKPSSQRHKVNRRLPTLLSYICGRCRHTAGELRAHLPQDLPIGQCEKLRYKIFNDKKATAKQRLARYKCVLPTFYTQLRSRRRQDARMSLPRKDPVGTAPHLARSSRTRRRLSIASGNAHRNLDTYEYRTSDLRHFLMRTRTLSTEPQ